MQKLKCGCTPDASGYGYCSDCNRALRKKIWARMSEGERNYDRQFAPGESADLDSGMGNNEEQQGCSCHINPPCGYCTSKNDGEED